MIRRGFMESLDPRTKIASAVATALAAALIPAGDAGRYAAYGGLLLALLVLSGFSFRKMIMRMLLLIPLLVFLLLALFVFKDASRAQKTVTAGDLIAKTFLVSGSFIILVLTTETHQIIKALERCKVPKIWTSLLFLAFRYLHVLARDFRRMWRAVESRSGGKLSKPARIRILSRMIALLAARSLERSQRVYAAMLSRGYAGKFETFGGLRFQRRDVVFGLVFLGTLVSATVFL